MFVVLDGDLRCGEVAFVSCGDIGAAISRKEQNLMLSTSRRTVGIQPVATTYVLLDALLLQ